MVLMEQNMFLLGRFDWRMIVYVWLGTFEEGS